MPWKELQPGRQGLLGLPIVIALEALRWKRPGTCSSGAAVDAESAKARNLRYDHLKVIATVDFESKPLDFILDTGDAAGTQFWERFANDFDRLINERGRKGIVRVTQIGGANDRGDDRPSRRTAHRRAEGYLAPTGERVLKTSRR
jgi:hypothetical protein